MSYSSPGKLRSIVTEKVQHERWFQYDKQLEEAGRIAKLVARVHQLDVVVEARWVLLEEKAKKEAEIEIRQAIIAQFQRRTTK